MVKNIWSVLKCEANDIEDIRIIQKGLTNVSFKFSVKGIDYVYRHPGINAPNVVDRKSEVFAQYKACLLYTSLFLSRKQHGGTHQRI